MNILVLTSNRKLFQFCMEFMVSKRENEDRNSVLVGLTLCYQPTHIFLPEENLTLGSLQHHKLDAYSLLED